MGQELREHLTAVEGAVLRPIHIYQAAVADLRLLERKQDGKVDPDLRYSFMARHVKRARSAEHLVALAFFEPLATDKESTLRIYNDAALLKVTLINLLLGADEDTLRRVEVAR